MHKTLIVLNPHAAGGRAGTLWKEIEPLLWEQLGELVVAVTQHPDEVAKHLDKAYDIGIRRVISIGGDGTNHILVNALADLGTRIDSDDAMVYGTLPIGTGRDWARGMGIPIHDFRSSAAWIAKATPRPTDLGLLESGSRREYFLNIASAGMSGEVAIRVNAAKRRPWTFLSSTVATLLSYQPPRVQVRLDGEDWYEGPAWLVAVANGTTFGHGMKIAPDAEPRDGLFDVVLVEGINRLRVLAALKRVYDATHLTHPNVRSRRARQITIRSLGGALGMELDGEPSTGQELTYTLQPKALNLLA